jgi:hypothetical protein
MVIFKGKQGVLNRFSNQGYYIGDFQCGFPMGSSKEEVLNMDFQARSFNVLATLTHPFTL